MNATLASGLFIVSLSCTSLLLSTGCATVDRDVSQSPARASKGEGFLSGPRRRAGLRAAHRLKSLVDENGNIPHDARMKAHAAMQAMRTEGTAGGLDSTKWTNIGPGNFGGRMRSIAFHPSSSSTIFIGSVSGGIWKTTNGGTSWTAIADSMENLGITSILFDPTNANVMYASTGEGLNAGDAIRGAGIFKSTNGGTTWARLAATNIPAFYLVNRLAISADGKTLLAGTFSNGIYRSTNGGTSWTNVHSPYSDNTIYDIKFHPTNSSRAVAYGITNIGGFGDWSAIYTTNGGSTWTNATGLSSTANNARAEFAWHRGFNNGAATVCYALHYEEGTTNTALLRSTNSGQTWSAVSSTNMGDQGDYDLAIWVDPSDTDNSTADDVIVAGVVSNFRSTNGGSTWTQISEDTPGSLISCHSDIHAIKEHPGFNGTTNRIVYFGSDGGIYRADNIYSVARRTGWTRINNGLNITQHYGIARSPQSGKVYAGNQDNGTTVYTGTNAWSETAAGDGGQTAADPTNANYLYGEFQYADVHRSSDGGVSNVAISNNITEAGDQSPNAQTAPFVAPIALDPKNPQTLLVGCRSLWRTTEARRAPADPSFAIIKAALASNSFLSAVEIAEQDSKIIWVGHQNGEVYSTANGNATTPTWTRRGAGTLPGRLVTRVQVDPHNVNRIFVTFGGYSSSNLWVSNNGGTSWTVVSTAPVAVPIRDIAIHPIKTKSSIWYVASEVGLLVTENNGTSFTSAATPANVSIDQLFFQSGNLWLGTHGRSTFHQSPFAAAAIQARGPSCLTGAGTTGGPALSATKPLIGKNFVVTVTGARTGSNGFLYLGIDATTPAPFLGCSIYLNTAALLNLGALSFSGTTGTMTLPVADNASLAGIKFALQAAVGSSVALHLTNGLSGTVGY